MLLEPQNAPVMLTDAVSDAPGATERSCNVTTFSPLHESTNWVGGIREAQTISFFVASWARPLVKNVVVPMENHDFPKNSLTPPNRKLMILVYIGGIFWEASWHTFQCLFGTPFCIDV